MADGEVQITEQLNNGCKTTSVQEMGPSYVFTNPDHPMAAVAPFDRMFRGRAEAAYGRAILPLSQDDTAGSLAVIGRIGDNALLGEGPIVIWVFSSGPNGSR